MKTVLLNSFQNLDFAKVEMPVITIYEKPRDFPEHYVGRLFNLAEPTEFCIIAETKEEIFEKVPKSLFFIDRDEKDEEHIIGIFL